MATSPDAARLTEAHRLTQARLGVATVLEATELWPLFDPDDPAAWMAAMARLINARRRQSAALAGGYYTAFRALEVGTPSTSVLAPTTLAPTEQVYASMGATGVSTWRRLTNRGLTPELVSDRAQTAAARAAHRLALNGGRNKILDTVARDRTSVGWQRVTDTNPCAFCALLAARGAVYKSRQTARFKPHDGCSCTPEPVYRRDTPMPDRSQQFADLYADTARGQPDPLNAFRRAYERP